MTSFKRDIHINSSMDSNAIVIVLSSDEEENVETDSAPGQSVPYEKCVYLSESDEDLPEVDLSVCVNVRQNSLPENWFGIPHVDHDQDYYHETIIASAVERRDDTLIYEPPTKKVKENEDLGLNDTEKLIFFNKLRKNVLYDLLTGTLKFQRPLCSRGIDICYNVHLKEGRATPSPPQSCSHWETMMDIGLVGFVLRGMIQAINQNQFLHPKACEMLLYYLCASEERKEAPQLQDFHLGIFVLKKQLFFHPPCRPDMRVYYLEICKKWWASLITETNNLLLCPLSDQNSNDSVQVKLENQNVSADILESTIIDLSDVASEKKNEKLKKFKNLKPEEKVYRMSILLQYLSLVMQSNMSVWLIKHRHTDSKAFRSDVSPIVAELMWGKFATSIGDVNDNVKALLRIFVRSIKDLRLHKTCSTMISLIAAVIHRYEKSTYPEMGDVTRTFAYRLFEEINAADYQEENVSSIQPDWLRFVVTSYFLSVEEPPNFYKVKERILSILNEQSSHFNEKLCLLAVKSMCGMLGMTTTNCEEQFSCLLEHENLWFSGMLEEGKIERQFHSLRTSLVLPLIKLNRGFYFDGFEDTILKP